MSFLFVGALIYLLPVHLMWLECIPALPWWGKSQDNFNSFKHTAPMVHTEWFVLKLKPE